MTKNTINKRPKHNKKSPKNLGELWDHRNKRPKSKIKGQKNDINTTKKGQKCEVNTIKMTKNI